MNVVVGALDTQKGGPDDNSAQAGHLVEMPAHTHTLTAEGFDASEDGTGRGTPLTVENEALTSKCLTTSNQRLDSETETFIPTYNVRTAQTSSNGWGVREGETGTLDATGGGAVAQQSVRRLTPTECERLQGFPDRWTLLPAQVDDPAANPKPDSHRYSMMGNAVTVNVAEWIGRRIVAHVASEQVEAA